MRRNALICLVTVSLGAVSVAIAQAPAPIDRVKLTDNELSCAQMHAEIGQMDKVVADARATETAGKDAATVGSAAGVAAEVASRSGLFGQIGGLTGHILGSVGATTAAGMAQRSGQQSAQQAAERVRQASARKEHLSTQFVGRGCRVSDLSHNPPPVAAGASGAAGAAGAVAGGTAAALAEAPVPEINATEFMASMDSHLRGELAKYRRVVVGGFRVGFVTKAVASDSIRASYRGGGVRSSGVNSRLELNLRGVEPARMQALADRAYQEFMSGLSRLGLEVIAHQNFASHPAAATISYASKAPGESYTVEHSGRTYVFFAPAGLRLWFGQGEPLGDQGAFGMGNAIAAGKFAFENKAVVLNPMLVVDFAETQTGKPGGFFNIRLSDSTEVGAKSAISLRSGLGMTQLGVVSRSAPIEMAIAGGNVALKEPVLFGGDFGEIVKVEESSNRSLVVGMALLGMGAGPVRNLTKEDLIADPARYEHLASLAVRTGAQLMVRSFASAY